MNGRNAESERRAVKRAVPWKWIGLAIAITALLIAVRVLPVTDWLTGFNYWVAHLGSDVMPWLRRQANCLRAVIHDPRKGIRKICPSRVRNSAYRQKEVCISLLCSAYKTAGKRKSQPILRSKARQSSQRR
jgi:hypothetical protein